MERSPWLVIVNSGPGPKQVIRSQQQYFNGISRKGDESQIGKFGLSPAVARGGYFLTSTSAPILAAVKTKKPVIAPKKVPPPPAPGNTTSAMAMTYSGIKRKADEGQIGLSTAAARGGYFLTSTSKPALATVTVKTEYPVEAPREISAPPAPRNTTSAMAMTYSGIKSKGDEDQFGLSAASTRGGNFLTSTSAPALAAVKTEYPVVAPKEDPPPPALGFIRNARKFKAKPETVISSYAKSVTRAILDAPELRASTSPVSNAASLPDPAKDLRYTDGQLHGFSQQAYKILFDAKSSDKESGVSSCRYYCYCGKDYVDMNGLNRHIRNFSVKKEATSVKCSMCPGEFKQLKYLKLHIKNVHNNQKPEKHSCSECAATFQTEKELFYHMLRIK